MMKITRKNLLLLIATALLLTVTVSGTVAFLVAGTEPLVNTFTPGVMDTKIEEDVYGNQKRSIKIQLHNNSTVDAYVRIALVGNWVDTDGKVVAPWDPNDPNAKFELNTDAWIRGPGGYYYHKTRIKAPDGATADLLKSAITVTKEQAGAEQLILAVIHQSIQADGVVTKTNADGSSYDVPAVVDAWGWWPSDIPKPSATTSPNP